MISSSGHCSKSTTSTSTAYHAATHLWRLRLRRDRVELPRHGSGCNRSSGSVGRFQHGAPFRHHDFTLTHQSHVALQTGQHSYSLLMLRSLHVHTVDLHTTVTVGKPSTTTFTIVNTGLITINCCFDVEAIQEWIFSL